MNYDPNEMFREDEEELLLDEETQLQNDLLRQAAEEEKAKAAAAVEPTPQAVPAPTGEQEQAPQAEVSTEPQQEQAPFDKSQDYSYYEAQGMSRGEWNRRQMETGTGGELEGFAQDPRYSAELAAAIPTGGLDFGVDLINVIPGVNVPKLTKFENETAQAVRDISSVLLPTIGGIGALRAAGTAAQARVGWSIGNTPFMQYIGNRGVEALGGLAVGAVSSEYEGENVLGMAKKAIPAQYDFIPDDLATLDTDEPAEKRRKNIYEDLLTGLVGELAVGVVRAGAGIVSSTGFSRKINKMIAESDAAQGWLKDNSPPPRPVNIEESVEMGMLRQEDALDEIGMYNLSQNPNLDKPLKGVHDMFDYTETAVRTVDDFGVVGASIDAARIARNLNVVDGRIGNMISEPALQYGLRGGGNIDDVVLGLADQLRQADRIGMKGRGWTVTFDDQIEASVDLTRQLFDPRMSRQEVRQIIEPYLSVNDAGVQVMSEEGFGMVSKALRGFGEEISAMDVSRAHSLLAGSLSGRVADLSEGIRLMDGTESVQAGQNKVIDLMEYLVQLQGSASFYKNRKIGMLQQIKSGFTNVEGYNASTVAEASEMAQKIFKKSQTFGTTLRAIGETNPNLMKQFLMAYEMTNGDISTVKAMNDLIFDMTGNLGKAIIDPNPEVQNKILGGIWANIYAGYLSAFRTPLSAMFDGVGGIISKPTSHFLGALTHFDFKAIRRGFVAYGAINDSTSRAAKYMGEIFAKASKDPDSVASITRRDLLLQKEDELDFLREVAASRAAEGEWGTQYVVQQIETMYAIAADPRMRFGSNALIATDGFTGSMIGHSESYFRAIDELMESGKPLTKENLGPIAQKHYEKMFDKNNLLKDEAVRWQTNELALNLDSPLMSGMNQMAQHAAFMKPFLMFPTTGRNRIAMFSKYAPYSPFQRDVNELAFTPLKQLLGNEEHIDNLLKVRGYDVANMTVQAKVNRITDLKYETLGRKAIGATAVGLTFALFKDDRITGDGHPDKNIQAARIKRGWKPRSIKLPNGKYVGYQGFGVLADWIASTVNTMDSFDHIGREGIEKMLPALGFVIGAATTDNTGLSTIRPLLDFLGGNDGAIERWSAGFLNGLGPLSGQRAEWSRIFSDGLRIVDNDLYSQLRNRNRFALEIDPKTADPFIYSPINGKKENSYSFLQRVWNAYTPFPIHDEQTVEEEFLDHIDYPTSSVFKTKDGVKIPPRMRSELMRIMGEDGHFEAGIKEVMRSVKEWKSLESFDKMQQQGNMPDLTVWHNIHGRLRAAQKFSEDAAYARLDGDMQSQLIKLKVDKAEKEAKDKFATELQPTAELYRN